MENRALFSLSGGGDHRFFWADPKVLDWVAQNEDLASGTRYVPLPPVVADCLRPDVVGDADREEAFREALEEGVSITPGSWQNDKALALATMLPTQQSLKEAMAEAARQGWLLAEEFNGHIY